MANRTKLTLKKKKLFIEQLRLTANVSIAAKYCAVCRNTAYEHKKIDPAFSEDWDQAVNEALDRMEEVLRRRAFDGVTKPVYQKGDLVGFVTEYSDTLAMFLLKAYRPEKFRENKSVELTGKGGGPIKTDNSEVNLSGLSIKELEVFQNLMEKVKVDDAA